MKVKIITYGCAYNKSDSRIISANLEKQGQKIVGKNPDYYMPLSLLIKSIRKKKLKDIALNFIYFLKKIK